jgi:phage-related minor tail protein
LGSVLGSFGGNQGVQVYSSAAAVGPFPLASAKGNIFMGGNVIPFASGGVINSPRIFPMANGGVGLAGEAGPEGILPLRRDSKGNLGVIAANSNKGGGGNVVVNVINNTNTKATTTERTDSNGGKTIEVMIDEMVAKKVGQSGSKTNRAIQQNFGISQALAQR